MTGCPGGIVSFGPGNVPHSVGSGSEGWVAGSSLPVGAGSSLLVGAGVEIEVGDAVVAFEIAGGAAHPTRQTASAKIADGILIVDLSATRNVMCRVTGRVWSLLDDPGALFDTNPWAVSLVQVIAELLRRVRRADDDDVSDAVEEEVVGLAAAFLAH